MEPFHLFVKLAHLVESVTKLDIFLRMFETEVGAVFLVGVETTESVVVAELQVAVVQFLQSQRGCRKNGCPARGLKAGSPMIPQESVCV